MLYFDPATGVQATELLEGYRSAGATEFGVMARVTQVFEMYRQLHGGQLLSTTKTLFDMIDEHRAQFIEVGGVLQPYQREVLELWDVVQESLVGAYLGEEPTPGELARTHLSGIGAAVKWGMWGLYNGTVRDVDFDYDKYGGGMLAAAHRWLNSDKAAWALKQL